MLWGVFKLLKVDFWPRLLRGHWGSLSGDGIQFELIIWPSPISIKWIIFKIIRGQVNTAWDWATELIEILFKLFAFLVIIINCECVILTISQLQELRLRIRIITHSLF